MLVLAWWEGRAEPSLEGVKTRVKMDTAGDLLQLAPPEWQASFFPPLPSSAPTVVVFGGTPLDFSPLAAGCAGKTLRASCGKSRARRDHTWSSDPRHDYPFC